MKIYLNLASSPWRNRRPFFFLAGPLLLLTLIFLIISLWLFINYLKETREVKLELIRIARREDTLRREQRQFEARAAALAKNFEGEVDLTNSIISDKSFSWSQFFWRLEQALPPACYLSSLTFNRRPEARLEIKFKLASPDLNSLLHALEKLGEAGFSGLQVQSEDLSGRNIISEVTMTYERVD
jgi:hypothetical protein